MKKVLCLCLTVIYLLSLVGCARKPAVNSDIQPEKHFTYYKELTDMYGMFRVDVFELLQVDLQEVTIIHEDRLGIPRTERYAGVDFAIFLQFGGNDSHFHGVDNEITYQYPEDEEKLLRDIVSISKSLINDFGTATDTSYVFNWVEVKLKEKWNRDITYWQDIQVLKRLFDEGFDGELLYWDLTPVASSAIQEELKSYGEQGRHSLSFSVSIDEHNDTARLNICY